MSLERRQEIKQFTGFSKIFTKHNNITINVNEKAVKNYKNFIINIDYSRNIDKSRAEIFF